MGVALPLPPPRLAVAQLVLSASTGRSRARFSTSCCRRSRAFLAFLGVFLVSILLGMASHVPGGLGVFEGLMVLLLKPYLESRQLLSALVVYRAVYYFLPLTAALVASWRTNPSAACTRGARGRRARPPL